MLQVYLCSWHQKTFCLAQRGCFVTKTVVIDGLRISCYTETSKRRSHVLPLWPGNVHVAVAALGTGDVTAMTLGTAVRVYGGCTWGCVYGVYTGTCTKGVKQALKRTKTEKHA